MSLENQEAQVNIKIAAESKIYTQEEARQHMQDAVNKLNQRIGEERYVLNGTQITTDGYGIATIKFNIKYLGQHLTTIEACLSPNVNGLRHGVDLAPENVSILLAAATIQLRGGLAKDGYLLNQKPF